MSLRRLSLLAFCTLLALPLLAERREQVESVPPRINGATASVDLGAIKSGPSTIFAGQQSYEPAVVYSPSPDPNPDNSSTVTPNGMPSPILAISKTGPAAAQPGGDLTYHVTVANSGQTAANQIHWDDKLAAGLRFVSLTQDSGPAFACNPPPGAGGVGTLVCQIPTFDAGASASFALVVHLIDTYSASVVLNSASISTNTGAGFNRSEIVTTAITPGSADLSITKTPNQAAPYVPGAGLTYTLTVSNSGPSAATGVVVTDILPPGTTFVSAIPSQGTCSGTSTVTCTLGTINNAASATIALTLILPSSAGSVPNTASVTATTPDPNTANNSSTATISTLPSANIPTLSSLLLLLLAAGLALAGFVVLRLD